MSKLHDTIFDTVQHVAHQQDGSVDPNCGACEDMTRHLLNALITVNALELLRDLEAWRNPKLL